MFPLPIVLMYHSVAEAIAGTDPFNLHVSPENFRHQIEALSKVARIISLTELAGEMACGKTLPATVAVTFDDAYENNLSVAAPILRAVGAPATLFVCPGLLGRDHFWWDRLFETVITARRIPSGLPELPAGGDHIDTLLLQLKRHDSHEARRDLSLRLWQILQKLDLERIDSVLAHFGARFEPRCMHDRIRPMRQDEVRASASYFDIGAHSMTHPAMTSLDSQSLVHEIVESKAACMRLAGAPVTGFAYPFGDVNAAVATEVSRHVSFACTTREAAVSRWSRPWNIPRLHVHDWRAEKLMAKIEAVTRSSSIYPPLRLAVQAIRNPRKAALDLAQAARMRVTRT